MHLARYRISMLSGGGSRSNLSCMVGGTKKATVMFSEGAVCGVQSSGQLRARQIGGIELAKAKGASSSDAGDAHRTRECCKFILRIMLRLPCWHTERSAVSAHMQQGVESSHVGPHDAILVARSNSGLLYTSSSQVPGLMSHHIGASVHSRLVLRAFKIVELAISEAEGTVICLYILLSLYTELLAACHLLIM
jgi:hypothetical protein